MYVLTGLALLLAPEWFYWNIGYYPPFNRHYAGDMGTAQTALGVGMLLAAWAPYRNGALILTAAIAAVLHAGNHLFDALTSGGPLLAWLAGEWPLILAAVLLLAIWRLVGATRPA